MANTNKPDLAELIMEAFAVHGPLTGQDLMARTGITDGQQAMLAVQKGMQEGWIGRDGDSLGLSPKGVEMYQALVAQREAAQQQAQPANDLSGLFGGVATAAVAPAQGTKTASKGGKKGATPKPVAAQQAQPDEERVVEYIRLDYLTPEQLEFGIAVGTNVAKQYVAAGGPENTEIAVLIMRSVSRYQNRLRRAQKAA